MTNKTFQVNGMKCVHCKARVENALQALDGVSKAEASVENKNVCIEYDEAKTDEAAFKKAVEDAGYTFGA